jgi:hypothetical protein
MTAKCDDATLRTLRHVPVLQPDAARTERLRTRCHGVLARRHQQAERSKQRGTSYRTLTLDAALLGALSVVYLLGLVYDVLRLHALR